MYTIVSNDTQERYVILFEICKKKPTNEERKASFSIFLGVKIQDITIYLNKGF